MEIAGHRLFFPKNFLFLNRLPARFEILVLARGAETKQGTAFELQVQGQHLVLKSKTELKVGARYELEKISTTEFKVARELKEIAPSSVENIPAGKVESRAETTAALQYLLQDSRANADDILALKVMADQESGITQRESKFAFDWEKNLEFAGVFVEQSPGQYSLFVSGNAATQHHLSALRDKLSDLGVIKVQKVSPALLAQIAQTAVDIQT